MLSNDTIERMIAEGKGHQVQKVFTIANATTQYFAYDFTGCTKVYARPLIIKPNQGLLKISTYAADDYTGGSAITPVTLVENTVASKAVVKSGVTVGNGTYNVREYLAGTKSTNQSSGSGGTVGDAIPKEIPVEKPFFVKVENTGTDSIDYEFGIVWVEA